MFNNWLSSNSKLSFSSVEKYTRAVNVISREMMELEVINKSLDSMSVSEYDIALFKVLTHPKFILKNTIGHSMYSNALKRMRCYLVFSGSKDLFVQNMVNEIELNPNVAITEKELIIKSRIGQGKFRRQLINEYSACVVTGVKNTDLLIASHIVPWSISDNDSRLSVDNGLLLTPTYDKLFDSGLITILKTGKIYTSKFITDEDKSKLNIQDQCSISLRQNSIISEKLEYHNENLFVR